MPDIRLDIVSFLPVVSLISSLQPFLPFNSLKVLSLLAHISFLLPHKKGRSKHDKNNHKKRKTWIYRPCRSILLIGKSRVRAPLMRTIRRYTSCDCEVCGNCQLYSLRKGFAEFDLLPCTLGSVSDLCFLYVPGYLAANPDTQGLLYHPYRKLDI